MNEYTDFDKNANNWMAEIDDLSEEDIKRLGAWGMKASGG